MLLTTIRMVLKLNPKPRPINVEYHATNTRTGEVTRTSRVIMSGADLRRILDCPRGRIMLLHSHPPFQLYGCGGQDPVSPRLDRGFTDYRVCNLDSRTLLTVFRSYTDALDRLHEHVMDQFTQPSQSVPIISSIRSTSPTTRVMDEERDEFVALRNLTQYQGTGRILMVELRFPFCVYGCGGIYDQYDEYRLCNVVDGLLLAVFRDRQQALDRMNDQAHTRWAMENSARAHRLFFEPQDSR